MKFNNKTLDFEPRKEIISSLICSAIVVVFIFTTMGIGGYSDTHYSIEGEVCEVNNNRLILVDKAGYTWELIDRPDLELGQQVKIKFFNNTTDNNRLDDEIIGVRVLP